MRQRKLKVWCGMGFRNGKQERVVVAAYNQREVAEITNNSLHYIRNYWSETGNVSDIERAKADPFKEVFIGRH